MIIPTVRSNACVQAVVHALRLRKCGTAMAAENGCDGDKAA